jgi:hypothetical protein
VSVTLPLPTVVRYAFSLRRYDGDLTAGRCELEDASGVIVAQVLLLACSRTEHATVFIYPNAYDYFGSGIKTFQQLKLYDACR